jgi:hypothetical protein
MSDKLPSTLELVDAPELAALHVLETALEIAEQVLIAAYPELAESLDFECPTRLITEACLADAIIVHISGLQTALFRYRIQLRSRGLLTSPSF